MATDTTTTKIDAGAWGTIHVSSGCGGVVIDSPLPADGERSARVILNAAQGNALIAAIGRALGRPATTDGWLLQQAEAWARNPDAMIPASHVLAAVRAWAGREQGATVPRAGVAAVVANFEANAITADKGEQFGKDTRNAHLEACSKAEAKVWRRAADAVRAATLEAAGLWPVAAPGGER